MTLFKNRIPRDAVSFSAKLYELPPLQTKKKEKKEAATVEKSEQDIQLEKFRVQLELEQQQLLKKQRAIEEEKGNIEEMRQSIVLEKEQLEQEKLQYQQEIEQRKHEIEKAKKRMYYDICEFMWDQSIEVAENIIHQAVDTDQISIIPLLEGTIQQLPISFEKLHVIVHPETVQKLKGEHEGTKTHWLLDNLEWKYDLSLQVGEFLVEEEKEFFEYRFQEIFQMLRKKLNEGKLMEEKEDD